MGGSMLPPIEVVLSWPKPNYTDPVTRGKDFYVISLIFLTLATIVVFTRLYARIFIRRWFGLDDAFVVVAWLAAVGVTAVVFLGTDRAGWDRHIWDVEFAKLGLSGKLLAVSCLFWAVSSSCVRLSLLCFYFRLVEHLHIRQYRWVLYSVIATSVSFLIAYLLFLIFMCTPIDAYWSWPPKPNATCIELGWFLLAMSVINTLLELVCAILPIPAILSLHMDKRQRLGVFSVLCLGFLVVLVGCVRIYYVYKTMLESYDATWYAESQWIASEVENDISLICACAPALRPILGRLLSKGPIRPKKDLQSDTLVSNMSVSLHPKEKMQTTLSSTQVWFDLEGIQVDNLGYSVSINAGTNSSRQGKLRKRLGSTNCATRSVSRLRHHLSTSNLDDSTQHSSARVGIITTRSVEIRESFHEEDIERLKMWQLQNEKDHESDWNDESLAGLSQSHLDGRSSRAHQEAMRGSPIPSSDGDDENNVTMEESQPDITMKDFHHELTTSSVLPQSRPLSGQSLISAPVVPRPGSRGPASPLNSSQAWAVPRVGRPRQFSDHHAIEKEMR